MKIRTPAAGIRSQLEILAPKRSSGYEEISADLARLESAERQAKLRSRQMAASSVRYCRETGITQGAILETDVVKLIEMIAASLPREFDDPRPFSEEVTADLQALVGSKDQTWDAWERVAKGLSNSAERELALEDFLVFDAKVEEFVRLLRCLRWAQAVDNLKSVDVSSIAARVLQFCQPEDNTNPEDCTRVLENSTTEFLARMASALRTGSPSLIRYEISAAAAEVLAGNMEMSAKEWHFYFGTLEHALHKHAGPQASQDLYPWFDFLIQAIPRLPFAGYLAASAEKLSREHPEIGEAAGAPVEPFLRLCAAEVISSASPSSSVSPVDWSLVHRCSMLGGLAPDGLPTARRKLLDVLHRDVERSWTDWLAEFFDRLERVLVWCERQDAIRDHCRKLAESAHSNLREALEAVGSNPLFSSQLSGLLQRATLAWSYFGSTQSAAAFLRSWFVPHVAMAEQEKGWSHAKTIMAAIKTSLRQNSESFSRHLHGAAEILEGVEDWLADGAVAVEVWPRFTTHSLHLERYVGGESCQRDSLWLLRRGLVEFAARGRRVASAAVLEWMTREVVAFAPSHKPDDFEANAVNLQRALTALELESALPEGLQSVFSEIFQGVHRAALRHHLWTKAEEIGAAAADEIYNADTVYREKAGDASRALCARDCSMILRRTAASLAPSVEDSYEYVGSWWASLVNVYLQNRTPDLFSLQCAALESQTTRILGRKAGALVRQILKPVLEPSTRAEKNKLPMRLVFRSMELEADARRLPASALARQSFDEALGELHAWLETALPEAMQYAEPLWKTTSHSKPSAEALRKVIWDGWRSFLTGSGMFGRSLREAISEMFPSPESCMWGCRVIAGLLYATERLGEAQSAAVAALLGLWQSWFRQRAAGLELSHQAAQLSEACASHIHQVVPDVAARGVSAPSQEKCQRDFTYVLRALADALASLPPPAANIEIRRYVIQMVLPYTGYARDIWRMMWQAAAWKLEESPDGSSSSYLREIFAGLESIGWTFETLGPIAKKVNAGDAPVFSPNPAEEAAWRDVTNGLLALALLPEEQAAGSASLLALAVPQPIRSEFDAKLPKLLAAVRKWFPAFDLRRLDEAARLVLDCREKQAKAAASFPEIQEAAVILAQSSGTPNGSERDALAFLALLVDWSMGLRPPVGGSWGAPEPCLLRWFAQKALAALDLQSAAFANTLHNLIGGVVASREPLDHAIESLRRANFPAAATASAAASSAAELPATCRRDQTWLIRRTIHAFAMGGKPGDVVDWLRREVAPHAGTHSPATWQAVTRTSLTALENATQEESARQFIRDVRKLVSRWVLSRVLAEHSEQFGQRLVERLQSQGHHVNAEKCQRDARLALLAMARVAEGTSAYSSWQEWWSDSVGRFLSAETLAMRDALFEGLPELLRERATEETVSEAWAMLN